MLTFEGPTYIPGPQDGSQDSGFCRKRGRADNESVLLSLLVCGSVSHEHAKKDGACGLRAGHSALHMRGKNKEAAFATEELAPGLGR
jgi:hypothetical protein